MIDYSLFFVSLLDCLRLYIGFEISFSRDRIKSKISIFISFVVFTILNFLLFNYMNINSFSVEIFKYLLQIVFILTIYRNKVSNKIIYFVIITCISMIVFVSEVLFIKTFELFQMKELLLINLIYQIGSILLYLFMYKILNFFVNELSEKTTNKFMKLLLFPALSFIFLLKIYFNEVSNNMFNFLLIITMTTFLVVIVLLVKYIEMEKIESNNDLLNRFIRQNEKHFETIQQNNVYLRKVKHDFNSHLLILGRMVRENDRKEIASYMESLLEKVNKDTRIVRTNNMYIDTILNQIYFENEDINFDFSAKTTKEVFLDPLDLISLLTNLLYNAVEEVRQVEDKIIVFKLEIRDEIMFLSVKNTYHNFKSLKTTKENKTEHGLGLSIINEIVSKYNGDIEIKQEKMFAVNIVLFK